MKCFKKKYPNVSGIFCFSIHQQMACLESERLQHTSSLPLGHGIDLFQRCLIKPQPDFLVYHSTIPSKGRISEPSFKPCMWHVWPYIGDGAKKHVCQQRQDQFTRQEHTVNYAWCRCELAWTDSPSRHVSNKGGLISLWVKLLATSS